MVSENAPATQRAELGHGVRSETITVWWPTCDTCAKVVDNDGYRGNATQAAEIQENARALEGVFQCDDCWNGDS